MNNKIYKLNGKEFKVNYSLESWEKFTEIIEQFQDDIKEIISLAQAKDKKSETALFDKVNGLINQLFQQKRLREILSILLVRKLKWYEKIFRVFGKKYGKDYNYKFFANIQLSECSEVIRDFFTFIQSSLLSMFRNLNQSSRKKKDVN